jgi:hypothetical protein
VTKLWVGCWESQQEEEQVLKEKEDSADKPNAFRRKPARSRHSVGSESEKEQREGASRRKRIEQAQERERKKEIQR